MKRVFLGTMVVLMAGMVSLVGCGEKDTATESAAPAASDAAEAADESANAEPTTETTEHAADETEASPADGADATPEASGEPFDEALMGEVKDGVYKNEKLGFELKLPEGWKAYSPQEIMELNGGQGMVDGMLGLIMAGPQDPKTTSDFNRFMLHIQKKKDTDNILAQLNAQKDAYDMALTQMQASASETDPQIKIAKNTVEEKKMDGHTVYIATVEVKNETENISETVYQYVAEAGDYFVVGTIQVNSDETDKAAIEAMDSLKFS